MSWRCKNVTTGALKAVASLQMQAYVDSFRRLLPEWEILEAGPAYERIAMLLDELSALASSLVALNIGLCTRFQPSNLAGEEEQPQPPEGHWARVLVGLHLCHPVQLGPHSRLWLTGQERQGCASEVSAAVGGAVASIELESLTDWQTVIVQGSHLRLCMLMLLLLCRMR